MQALRVRAVSAAVSALLACLLSLGAAAGLALPPAGAALAAGVPASGCDGHAGELLRDPTGGAGTADVERSFAGLLDALRRQGQLRAQGCAPPASGGPDPAASVWAASRPDPVRLSVELPPASEPISERCVRIHGFRGPPAA
jgi:hypothetical protein